MHVLLKGFNLVVQLSVFVIQGADIAILLPQVFIEQLDAFTTVAYLLESLFEDVVDLVVLVSLLVLKVLVTIIHFLTVLFDGLIEVHVSLGMLLQDLVDLVDVLLVGPDSSGQVAVLEHCSGHIVDIGEVEQMPVQSQFLEALASTDLLLVADHVSILSSLEERFHDLVEEALQAVTIILAGFVHEVLVLVLVVEQVSRNRLSLLVELVFLLQISLAHVSCSLLGVDEARLHVRPQVLSGLPRVDVPTLGAEVLHVALKVEETRGHDLRHVVPVPLVVMELLELVGIVSVRCLKFEEELLTLLPLVFGSRTDSFNVHL